jgi:HlyD family secretion protein
MKTWKKVGLGVGIAVVAAGIVTYSIKQANKDTVTVQTAKVTKQRLTSVVTASGEIRPRNYANVLAEGFGPITDIVVKEGDHVKKGDVLMHVDRVQASADADAQAASLSGMQASMSSAEAANHQAEADLITQQANLAKAKSDWDRGRKLLADGLIPAQQYDQYKMAYDAASSSVASAQARLSQTKAQIEQARYVQEQSKSQLVHLRDVLNKTTYRAPIDGVVTYIAMRVGESIVTGIQNSSGSYLMTIADLSIVNSETMVDETDIVNLRNGQKANVTIDAMPGQTFTGTVTEVGTQGVLRTSGLATTQTTTGSQEARDFKVVVTLDHPPDGIRPGLSCTSKVMTAERSDVIAIPIQALAMRSRKELEEAAKQAASKGHGDSSITLAASMPAKAPTDDPKKDDVQGVFVVRNGKVVFVQVQTGISGVTDIEITNGLKEGDEIVTGSYKALRTLKPDTPVKIDNKTTAKSQSETT